MSSLNVLFASWSLRETPEAEFCTNMCMGLGADFLSSLHPPSGADESQWGVMAASHCHSWWVDGWILCEWNPQVCCQFHSFCVHFGFARAKQWFYCAVFSALIDVSLPWQTRLCRWTMYSAIVCCDLYLFFLSHHWLQILQRFLKEEKTGKG
jgi:hypothetical protein